MKDELLELLKQQEGVFLSGEEISSRLSCTRQAVWKQISRLRRQGYEFEAVSRLGYRLVAEPDRLQMTALLAALTTRTFGMRAHLYESLDSTQNKAQELVGQGAPEGTLVVAEQQLSGRGRMGRGWHSPPGKGLWLSLVLKPRIPLPLTPQLTLLTAVALCRAVRRITGLDAGIKWPNDLLVNGRKISGILLESTAEDERLRYVIAGVGVNVNHSAADFPPELRETATSLRLESGRAVNRTALLALFLAELEELYDLYHDQGFAPIRTLWEALSVTLGRTVRFQTGTGAAEGMAEGLDDSGALCVRHEDGTVRKFYSGLE